MRAYFRRASQKISKLTDAQIEEFLNAIVDENDMFNSMFDSLTTGVMIIDSNFVLRISNKAAERLLPFSVRLDDYKADNVAVWKIIDDEPIADFIRSCHENSITNVSNDFSTTTAAGSVRFVTISILPFVQKNELVGAIVTVRDITEMISQQIRLRRTENLAGLTNIAAGMAHEIKNPLGAISIHIQLIQKAVAKARAADGLLPEEKFLEKHLGVINEEIDTLNKTVMDFLMAVRPVKAELVLANPAGALENVVEFVAPEFKKEGHSVSLKMTKNSCRLLIDEKLFRKVVMNLAQNALAALRSKKEQAEDSEEQGDKNYAGRLDLATFLKDDNFVLTVEDNGCGMSGEVAERIFEPYYTTKANGTGLGMTMVYKIIKEFSGDIKVQSEEGVGTLFTITIPVPQSSRMLLSSNADIHTDESANIAEKMAGK